MGFEQRAYAAHQLAPFLPEKLAIQKDGATGWTK